MNNTAIPIIIVHKGNPDYLHICLKQAHYSNPNSRIILLGDESNKNCLPFVEWYNIFDYYQDASNFEKIYKHYSCNALNYERFALAKWFAINDFIKKSNINQFFVNDSDVLIYTNFEEDAVHNTTIRNYDFTISKPGGQESMFFNNQLALQKFCDYIMGIFQNEMLMEQIDKISKMPGWCCIPQNKPLPNSEKDLVIKNWNFCCAPLSDMTALYWFIIDTDLKFFDYTNNDIDNKVINISSDDADYMLNGLLMNIEYINKKPFAYNKKMNKLVQQHTLHFQGWKKELMGNYATFDKNENFTQPKFSLWQLTKIYNLIPKIKIRKAKKLTTLFSKLLFKQ